MAERTLVVLDIETIPDGSLWTPEMDAKREKRSDEEREDPFPPPWAHQVIVIGILWLGADHSFKKLGLVGQGTTDEVKILRDLGSFLDRERPLLVTYNGRRFDLPVMALRSLKHGVPANWYFTDRNAYRMRFRSDPHVDLCEELSDHGSVRRPKLHDAARLCGLPGKMAINGSQVESLATKGAIEAVQRYCLSDVLQTALVYLRFLVMRGDLTVDVFRARAEALRKAVEEHPAAAELLDRADWPRYALST